MRGLQWPVLIVAIFIFPFQTILARLSVVVDCPNQFTATVTKIEKEASPTPLSHLEKLIVHTKVDFVKHGLKEVRRSFKVLKYGPIRFKMGSQYKLSMKEGLICSVSEKMK